MTSKNWVKPELVVVIRFKQEETLITNCKVDSASLGPNSGSTKNRCSNRGGQQACTVLGTS